VALQTFRSPIRLAMIVATITALVTGNRASRPSAIRRRRTRPSGPEHGNAVRFSEKRKTQVRRDEIGDADRNG